MTKTKICGLTRLCDIDAVNAVKLDYVGFVFAESRRKVTTEQAAKLKQLLRPSISVVGVFVDEPAPSILSLVNSGVIDVIQLHGSENEEYIFELKQLTNKPVIKAISVQSKGDVQKWSETAADFLLLDHKSGGTGHSFDWDLIGKVDGPFFLAGGLNAENVTKAIKKTTPFAVDVSSGVETNGVKNPIKIKEFIKAVINGQ